jgi:hypothetical protein
VKMGEMSTTRKVWRYFLVCKRNQGAGLLLSRRAAVEVKLVPLPWHFNLSNPFCYSYICFVGSRVG